MERHTPIIDADAHVNPPPTFWRDYLPSGLVDKAPRIEAGGPGEDHDWVVFEGTRKPFAFLAATAGTKVEQYKKSGRQSDLRTGNWDPASRLADMDVDGVNTAVIFGGGPLGTSDNELYVASFEAYNRWLADFCRYDPHRLAGVAYLPMQDVDQSIAMLKDSAKLGVKAVNIPAFPQSQAGVRATSFAAQALALTGDPDGPRQYDDPEFDSFWKAAVDHDMAITIHLGARVTRPGEYRFLPNLVMTKLSMAEPIAILIFGCVFDRFPQLRFGSIESGVGWFSWMAEYMDNIWHNQRHWTKNALKNTPSFYMDQNIYGSFIRDTVGVANRNKIGGRNIMWSTDYPHSETTWPKSQENLTRHFEGVSEADKKKIVFENAKRFFAI